MMQVLVNSIVYASEIAIIAVGIALSYVYLALRQFRSYPVRRGRRIRDLSARCPWPAHRGRHRPRRHLRRRSGGRRRRACLQPASRHCARRQDDRLLGRGALHPGNHRLDLRRLGDRYRDERRPHTGGRALLTSLDLVVVVATVGFMVALQLFLHPHAPRFGSARARQQLRSCRDARHIRPRHDPGGCG